MPPVRFILLALACSSSIAHAGAVVSYVPAPSSNGMYYFPGEIVSVDVFLQLTAGGPLSLRVRELQFGLSNTSTELAVSAALTHADTESHGDLYFWDFSSTFKCRIDPTACGSDHAIDDGISPPDNVLNVVYTSASESSIRQIILTQVFPVRVGVLEVTVLELPGDYVLDVLNADEPDFRNYGAFLRFGSDDEIVEWSAYAGDLIAMEVPEPAPLVLLLLGSAFALRRKFEKDI